MVQLCQAHHNRWFSVVYRKFNKIIKLGYYLRNNLNNRQAVYNEDNVIIKSQGCVSDICILFSSWARRAEYVMFKCSSCCWWQSNWYWNLFEYTVVESNSLLYHRGCSILLLTHVLTPPGLPRNNLNNCQAVWYKDDAIIKNQGCASDICISFNFEQGEQNMSWPNTQDYCWMTIQLISEFSWRHCSRVNEIFVPSQLFDTPILAWEWSP